MLKKFLYGIEVLTGVEIAESKLTDRRHRPFLHTAEEVYKIPIEIVVNLKGMHFGLAEQYAAGAAEHIYKSPEF